MAWHANTIDNRAGVASGSDRTPKAKATRLKPLPSTEIVLAEASRTNQWSCTVRRNATPTMGPDSNPRSTRGLTSGLNKNPDPDNPNIRFYRDGRAFLPD